MAFGQALFAMAGLHILADFICQGWFVNGKQKAWWRKMCRQELGKDLEETEYRYDYLVGVVLHSLFWSMLVCLPFFSDRYLWAAVLANTAVHAVVDELKANRFQLNLLQDQILHFLQIAITLAIMRGSV